MIKNKEKGFTLIELLAVIVVLAILALIAVPIVLNIINKANKQAEERSIESYARALDYAISECMMENPKLKKENIIVDNYEVKVSSTNEVCAKVDVSKGTEITGCTYEASDNAKGYNLMYCKIKDNYYNYIDGKVLEEREIVYSVYNIGDEVTYKGMKFYVISPSSRTKDYVTLLKDEPLTFDEVKKYGTGHVNRYTESSVGTPNTVNGTARIAYYTSENCGYINGSWIDVGCTTNYDESEIKYVVEAWKTDTFKSNDLKEDDLGYEVRLITLDELTLNLGYGSQTQGTIYGSSNGDTPSWVYNDIYYWTMSPTENSAKIWMINPAGFLYDIFAYYESDVRPVVNLKKSAIE